MKKNNYFFLIFSIFVFNFNCKTENNVSIILNSLGLINSITIISFENPKTINDTIYHTMSTNEINYFKCLFVSSGHKDSEGKTYQMTSTVLGVVLSASTTSS